MASKPELTYKEVMTEMGRVWNQELDEEQKAPFLAQRQQLVVEWKKAMDPYKLDAVEKDPEATVEGAEVVGGHVLEKGDVRSKEEPKDVEQGGEFKEEDGWRWTEGDGDTEIAKVKKGEDGGEFKEEGDKRDEDMEINGRQEGAVEERDIKGEVGDLGSEKGTEQVQNSLVY